MRTLNNLRASIGLASTVLILLFACEFPPADYSEYVGVNFLEPHGFDDESWIPDQSAPYLLFEAINATVSASVGTPGAAPANSSTAVYRFEVLNLIPNGDFEDTTAYSVGDTPDGWSATDNLSTIITAEISAIGSVGGDRELTILIDETADDISFNLRAIPGGANDGLVTNAIYGLRFDFKPSEPNDYLFFYDDTVDSTLPSIPIWESLVTDPSQVYNFPFDFAEVTSEFSASATQNLLGVNFFSLHIIDYCIKI